MAIYEPHEDSFLLASCVREHARGSVLDMGSGSGIQAEAALSATAVTSVLCADIDEEAVALLKQKGFDAVVSDLFEHISGTFDTIIFNPPYLPADDREPLDSARNTTGGTVGNELVERFLSQAAQHLAPGGIILLLVSSLTPSVSGLCEDHGFACEQLAKEKYFFETLVVLRLQRAKH